MDNTKEYIWMCEKAIEIQKLRLYEKENFYINNFRQRYGTIFNSIWLPRQDQLQDMLKIKSLKELNINFHFFLGFDRPDNMNAIRRYDFKSMEQLWLALVMKRKYNKIWNETDWVKESKK